VFDKKQGLEKLSEFVSLSDLASIDENDPAYVQTLISQVMELELKLRDQQSLIEDLEVDAMTDPLTGLVNRRVFESELYKSLAIVKRHKRKSAVLFIDVDAFKSINDQFGHLAGDCGLQHIAKILLKNVRPADIVARIGGDEFCIILNEVTCSRDVIKRTEILESLIARTPLIFDSKTIHLTASIGAKTFGTNDTFEGIMAAADSTMYQNKAIKS
jgi:two-component system cell cycle response regulator